MQKFLRKGTVRTYLIRKRHGPSSGRTVSIRWAAGSHQTPCLLWVQCRPGRAAGSRFPTERPRKAGWLSPACPEVRLSSPSHTVSGRTPGPWRQNRVLEFRLLRAVEEPWHSVSEASGERPAEANQAACFFPISFPGVANFKADCESQPLQGLPPAKRHPSAQETWPGFSLLLHPCSYCSL